MNNPLSNIDTAPFESAVESAFEIVTDRFTDVSATLADVSETLGERMHDDVIPAARRLGEKVHDDVVPAAKKGAERTQTFVRTRTRVSMATVAGLALAVAFVVWLKKRGSDDESAADTAADRTGPRSVA